ncbi:MAG: hypothetical protein HY342_11770 [Candidatus Lambdaproteobacteria bacterium]|nr:hypothetical protein [Candidatus Lambdaproteobacteria bacterium]
MRRRPDVLSEKVETFLAFHRRVIRDFRRSLANAAHFIELADKAMEREPDNTVHLINQIREISLLTHLEDQFHEFGQMASMLANMPGGIDRDELREGMVHVKDDYEVLLAQAEDQAEKLAELLNLLEHPH